MKETYDKEEDVLNLQLAEGEYWKSIELPNGIVIDIATDGSILAVEVLKASKLFSGENKRVIEKAVAS